MEAMAKMRKNSVLNVPVATSMPCFSLARPNLKSGL